MAPYTCQMFCAETMGLDVGKTSPSARHPRPIKRDVVKVSALVHARCAFCRNTFWLGGLLKSNAMSNYSSTFVALVHEKSSEAAAANEPIASIEYAVGRMQVDLHRLLRELTLPSSQQNSEDLLEALVAIAVGCTRCAEDLVLPNLREETD